MSEIVSSHIEHSVDITQSDTADKNIICLEKEELLNKLYTLNEDNLLLTEQLKQYRIMVETLERKLTEFNNVQNKKHKQITDILLNILMLKKKQIQKGGSSKKYSKQTKHST